MTQYNANLNQDAGSIHTPARYDDDRERWIMDIAAPELLDIKSELESILSRLGSTLTVEDGDVKAELEAVRTRLDGVLNVKANDTDAELANLKQELIDVNAKLTDIEQKLNEQEYEDGAALTKLTGSNAEQRLFNAYAITSLATLTRTIDYDLSRFSDIDFLIENTLTDAEGEDVLVRFALIVDGRPINVKTESGSVRPFYVTNFDGETGLFAKLDAGRFFYSQDEFIDADSSIQNVWRNMKVRGEGRVEVVIRADRSPSNGALTIDFIGRV